MSSSSEWHDKEIKGSPPIFFKNMEDFISNWVVLSISGELLDLIGCIIPDAKKESDINDGLNGRKYLLKPFEYANKFHNHKNPTPAPGVY